MPYLGNKPVNNFVSFAKQDITGNGGTSYSLDYPVTGANDIDLYINNVRQEPTEAYSCSGSTLTLTEAVQSTDDIYAIFRGRALQTVVHPSDSALEASSANISGDTTLGGNLTVNIDHDSTLLVKDAGTNAVFISANTGQELYFGANNEYAFRIKNDGTKDVAFDNGGRVTMPSQPSFYVKDLAFSSGANSAGTAGTILHNIGAHYSTSNGRFTAPVAGTYVFYGSVQMFNSGTSDYVSVIFDKNGVQQGIEFVSGKVQNGGHYNDHHTQEGMAIIYCNASDYVNIRATRGARNQTQSVFGGYLLG